MERPKMVDGPCLWCGRYVREGRELSGATNPYDAAWHDDGDFGCDSSPENEVDEDGVMSCADHMRPYDLAIRLYHEANNPKVRRDLLMAGRSARAGKVTR